MRNVFAVLMASAVMVGAGCTSPGTGGESSSSSSTGGASSSGGTSQGASTSSSGGTSQGGSGSSAGNGSSNTGSGSMMGSGSMGSSGATSGNASSNGNTSSGATTSSSIPGGTPGGTVTMCRTLAAPTTGTCNVTAGNANILLEGNVLTPDGKSLHGGQVLVNGTGNIVCAACDCESDSAAQGATRITCANGVISPGLINSHDHLTFDQLKPYAPSTQALKDERFEHRHDWRRGLRDHTGLSTPSGGSAATTQGELRHLLSGVTSINGSGNVPGLLRNLDVSTGREGLSGQTVKYDTFPLGNANPDLRATGCDYPGIALPSEFANNAAYTPHISEGIDVEARNEFLCTSTEANGGNLLATQKSAFIHAVGLKAVDFAIMGANGTGVIWSPRSNVSLYGHTALVTLANRLGVEVALGTDWTPSGSINMLRELACADDLNRLHYNGFFSDLQLWEMVTLKAARLMGVDSQLGSLAPGHVADISIFAGDDITGTGVRQDWRAVIRADTKDVALVLRGGKVMTGDAAIVAALPTGSMCETVSMCGVEKRVCAQRETGTAFSSLASSAGYALYFCGTPDKEPSCVPNRPGDGAPFFPKQGDNRAPYMPLASGDEDGDGVVDASDNCPNVFNPIRPVDEGMQGDADGDMVGDVCDVCPLNAGAMTCSLPNPDDLDMDGKVGAEDNCPNIANPLQENMDGDDKGNVCDPCPNYANNGAAACLVTVYDIKTGATSGAVTLKNLVVTAVASDGYFLQVIPGSMEDMGADNSGVFVFAGATGMKPAAGNVVDLDGTAGDFFGEKQISNATFTVTDPMGMVPNPVMVTDPALVATGGMRAAALEGVLVEVTNMAGPMTVTDIAPAPGGGETAPTYEWVVTGGLRINDYLYRVDPLPAVNSPITFARGVLRFSRANSKLEPRSSADLGTALALVAFTPAQAFIQQGAMGVPGPVVRLSRAPAMDTFVAVTSADPLAVTVVGGGVTVPAGQTSAPVLLDGLLQSSQVKLTASLDTVSLNADVRVVGMAEMPVLQSFTIAPDTVVVGGTATATVTLDFPPFMDTPVGLATMSSAMLPATVTVAAGQLSATFDITAPATPGTVDVTASLGAGMLSAMLTVTDIPAMPQLILNEVDYDTVGTNENAEFVEVMNAGGGAANLSGLALVLVNGGNDTEYLRIPLTGMLAGGGFWVWANAGVPVAAGAVKVNQTSPPSTGLIQNGAPDAVVLYDTVNKVVLDVLQYEGDTMTITLDGAMVDLSGNRTTNLGDNNASVASLCRGTTGTAPFTDWAVCTTITPGAANVP